MNNITEYQVLSESRLKDLNKAVQIKIELGWQPQGGVSVLRHPKWTSDYKYFQAMVYIQENTNAKLPTNIGEGI